MNELERRYSEGVFAARNPEFAAQEQADRLVISQGTDDPEAEAIVAAKRMAFAEGRDTNITMPGPAAPMPQMPAIDGSGSIGEIPRNKAEEVLGNLGTWLQETVAPKLDEYGMTITLPDFLGGAELNPTLKDVTIGDLGKVLEDISYGFYPVSGGNVATGGIGTFKLEPEAMELLNVAPAVGAAVGAGKLLKRGADRVIQNVAENPALLTPKMSGTPGAQIGAVGDLSQKKIISIVNQAEAEGWDSQKILETFRKLGIEAEPDAPTEVLRPTPAAMGKAQKELHARFPNEYTDVANMDAPTELSFAKGMYKDPEKVGPSFDARLDDDGKAFRKWAADNQNQTAIHANQKTGNSIDFSTSCANRSCGSGACAYCYVEHVRTQKENKLGAMMSPKKVVENDYQGEVLRMPPSLVNAYNMDGGLRMFSFGDFRPGVDDDNVSRLLADAAKRGLYIKAITKEPELIKRFGNHPNLRINLSVDNVPRDISHAVTLDEAGKLKAQYPNLRIRTVALNAAEAEMYAKDPRVDVVTLYHGMTNFKVDRTPGSPTYGQKVRTDKLYEIVKAQNPKIVEKMGDEKFKAWLDTWEDNSPKTKFAKEFQEKYAGRVCCTSGKCAGDPTKCGFANKVAEKGGVALLILGGANSIFLGETEDNQVMWQ